MKVSLFLVFLFLCLMSANAEYGFSSPGEQTPDSTSVMERIFFVSDGKWEGVNATTDYDYIIVGSGFCGYAFADRVLSKNPHAKILILERGPFFLPSHFQALPMAFQTTVAAKLEIFPWTLSPEMTSSRTWLHGVAPFFGGRSTKWSGWCPRPTTDEMTGWPSAVINAANAHFRDAELLLNVTSADTVFPGPLQTKVMDLVSSNLHKVNSATRVISAPLSMQDNSKFSVVGPLLDLITRQQELSRRGLGAPLRVAVNCIVRKIKEDQGIMETSRGALHFNSSRTRIILAMGSIPPATLVMNSFPDAGNTFPLATHFISAVTARVPKRDLNLSDDLSGLGAFYLAGGTDKSQFHIQASVISDPHLENFLCLSHLMPDVLTSASPEQLKDSNDYVLFVFAILCEKQLSSGTWVKRNAVDSDVTTNILVQIEPTTEDEESRDTMETAAFELLEKVLSPAGNIEYFHPSNSWKAERPTKNDIRRPGSVHESSSLIIGDDNSAKVALDYRLKGSKSIYVTGGGLWPRSGSWNPTLTMVALTLDLADNLELTPKNLKT